MSLRPRRIVFEEVWGSLRKTVETVITLRSVNKEDWSAKFG